MATSSGSSVAEIDGSMLEGGGQILRNSAALATITGQTLVVNKIRAARSKPGLRAQHAAGMQLVAQISGGKLEGGEIGSCEIRLHPQRIKSCTVEKDVGTAGSCMLLLQAALPCLLMARDQGESELILKGGTDAAMAPPVWYYQHVCLPLLRIWWGLEADLQLVRRGFFPKGGGCVKLHVKASRQQPLPPLELTSSPSWTRITLRTFTAGRVGDQVAQRMITAAKQRLSRLALPSIDEVHDALLENALYMASSSSRVSCGILPASASRRDARWLEHLGLAANQRRSRMSRASQSCLFCSCIIPVSPAGDIRLQVWTAGQKPEMNISRAQASDDFRQASHALREDLPDLPLDICEPMQETRERAMGDGCGLLLTASSADGRCIMGAAGLGERGRSAEDVGQSAAQELVEDLQSGGCVDRWMQDQVVIFLSLATGRSSILCGEPTLHTRTAMVVAEQLTCAKFKVQHPKEPGRPWTVSCQGAGIVAEI